MKKQYLLTYADGYQMKVEIDHAIWTEEKLVETIGAIDGNLHRLARAEPVDVFLMELCAQFMAESSEHFDPEERFNSGEVPHFPPLNGSHGIELLGFEPFTFVPDLVEVEWID